MSSPRGCQEARRKVLRPNYWDRDYASYPSQEETQGDFSDLRTFDGNVFVHDSPFWHEENYMPSHMLGYPPSSQRGDVARYSETVKHKSRPLLELIPIDAKRTRRRRAESHDRSIRVRKSRTETPEFPEPRTPRSPESIMPPSSQREGHKKVRFSDEVDEESYISERFPVTVGHPKDTLRRQSQDDLPRTPGNGNLTGGAQSRRGCHSTAPKRLRSSERQRSHVPAAPVIPRLPTPDFDSTCHYESGLAKYEFCPCCMSNDEGEGGDVRWTRGKSKMDKQVDQARAYIERVTMSERLLAGA
ncbi:hypothetical protein F4802DRAFT_8437 [Xylaria palmicola]|nr:hypothetical protein F4802DRAFT_8437 [Xylaria palmicola]